MVDEDETNGTEARTSLFAAQQPVRIDRRSRDQVDLLFCRPAVSRGGFWYRWLPVQQQRRR
ncbi:hypothetical protein ACF1BQ_000175 [Bradyrhizobium sp. RDT10]